MRPPIPWNFFLIYVGSVMYFMSYSLEAATGSLTLLYFNYKGWGSAHRDYLYVAAMCTQAAMPIYAAPLLGTSWQPPASHAALTLVFQAGTPSASTSRRCSYGASWSAFAAACSRRGPTGGG